MKKDICGFLKNSEEHVLFLIHLQCPDEKIASFLNKLLCNHSHDIIFFNLKVPEPFVKFPLNMTCSQDYFTREELEEMDYYIFKDATVQWYRKFPVTDYQGFELGEIVEYDFQKYICERLKIINVLEAFYQKKKMVKKIVILEDKGVVREVVSLWSKSKNIQLLIPALSLKKMGLHGWNQLKEKISDYVSYWLEKNMLKRLEHKNLKKEIILMDTRLCSLLHSLRGGGLLPCLFEKGIRLRYKTKKYFPLLFFKKKHQKEEEGLKHRWDTISHQQEFQKFFTYKQIPLWSFVEKELSYYFLDVFPRMINSIHVIQHLNHKFKIKLMITKNDNKPLEKLCILVAQSLNIPSLVIQHGILAECNGHDRLLANGYAAWGNASQKWYEQRGNTSLERIKVIGNPKFDVLHEWTPTCSLPKKYFLFISQQVNPFSSFWEKDVFHIMAEEVIKILNKFPSHRLIIKADPYEDIKPYVHLIKRYKQNHILLLQHADLYSLIYDSDLIFTLDSTVGLEAMILNKPVIAFNITKRKDRVPYAETGAAWGIYKTQNLSQVIQRVLTQDSQSNKEWAKKRKQFVEEHAYYIDGKATQRFMQLIEGIPYAAV